MLRIFQIYLIKNFSLKFLNLTLIFLSLILILGLLEEISFVKNLDTNIFTPYLLTVLNAPITIFEIFPFIILLTTQFVFYDFFQKGELNLLKNNGLNNLKIIKSLLFITFIIGIFNAIIFYNLSSKMKFYYLNIKNDLSKDNKYLAMVNDSGLWIKDEIDDTILIIKSKKIKKNIIENVYINQFDKNFNLIKTIQSPKVDISKFEWNIYDSIVTEKNIQKELKFMKIETNFNEEKIYSFFSNITTLSIFDLFNLKKEFDKLGYSSNEIKLHITKLFITPIVYCLLTVISSIIMFNFSRDKSLIFTIILGILISVLIYYLQFVFTSLGNNGNIPIYLSIFFPLIILFLISIVGLININEK